MGSARSEGTIGRSQSPETSRNPEDASAASDRPVLLCGLMGSGKSTVGRLLAAALGWDFLDTDEEIERVSGRSVAEIFAAEGEAGFRTLERAVLEKLPARRAVVALGGGAIASQEARDLLAGRGWLVWLDAAPEVLLERLGDAEARPLLAGRTAEGRLERLRELLQEREAAYAEAPVRIATAGRSPDEVVAALASALGLELRS